ncbi:MAG TPA: PIN domain-containing protein [Phycisphaerae bacterium]|nr:PIN domain-containing protein [Phycisphaerae bacterium]
MNGRKVFVDTNILVYAHDCGAGKKHRIAQPKVAALWRGNPIPSLSVQVLQELYATLLRKDVPQDEALRTVEDHLLWHVVENNRALLLDGILLHQRHQVSFWDGLILAAARAAGAAELWSEDFAAGRRYDGVLVVNPLVD